MNQGKGKTKIRSLSNESLISLIIDCFETLTNKTFELFYGYFLKIKKTLCSYRKLKYMRGGENTLSGSTNDVPSRQIIVVKNTSTYY